MIRAGLIIRDGDRTCFDAKRIALLEAIGAAGSIQAAADALGLSYKGAWNAVQAMNAAFGQPLVRTRLGGRREDRAIVTAAGHAIISLFRSEERRIAVSVQGLANQFAPAVATISMNTYDPEPAADNRARNGHAQSRNRAPI